MTDKEKQQLAEYMIAVYKKGGIELVKYFIEVVKALRKENNI
jgi:hypothetical protein